MPSVTVRYFAMLRDAREPSGEERVELRPGETAGGLYARLFPPGPEGALPVSFAINQGWARAESALSDGDEVAFIPPVGGG